MTRRLPLPWVTITALLVCTSLAFGKTVPFSGIKSSFHSYVRYDFEHHKRASIVVVPKKVAEGKPWIWRARFFDDPPQVDIALLEQGFHLAYIDVAGLYGSPQAVAIWDDFYTTLTETHGLSRKPVLEGMSRGGLMVYNWAAKNPEKVACIYADAPVCDIKSWPGGKGKGRPNLTEWANCLQAYKMTEAEALTARCNPIDHLEPLAKAKVPLLHVVGDADLDVPVAENTALLEERYKKLGGHIEVIHKPGVGHNPHCLEDPTPIVKFILTSLERRKGQAKRASLSLSGGARSCQQDAMSSCPSACCHLESAARIPPEPCPE